ncbi:MAG: hypothetical protein WKF58_15320 [Ilumatobacteraceae bacterium]
MLGKVLIALGLALVVYLAFRFVIGLIKWLLIVVAARRAVVVRRTPARRATARRVMPPARGQATPSGKRSSTS